MFNFSLITIYLDFLISRIIPLLICVAYYVLLERKLMSSIQRRKGPNVAGFFGVLQPLADGLKLFLKEMIIPKQSEKPLFLFAPLLTFALALLGWLAIPFSFLSNFFELEYTLLFIYLISSLAVFSIIGSGWSSNTKYSFLGSVRAVSQMISYEVAIGFIFLIILSISGSLNLRFIVFAQQNCWFIRFLWPVALVFFITILAETNRAPFDLPEAEAELVAGFNLEYSGMGFALFFLGEYANMILMSCLFVILFFGGWLPPKVFSFIFFPEFWFSFKMIFLVSLFVVIRAAYPRVRFDQLIFLGWQWFLPFTLLAIIVVPYFYGII